LVTEAAAACRTAFHPSPLRTQGFLQVVNLLLCGKINIWFTVVSFEIRHHVLMFPHFCRADYSTCEEAVVVQTCGKDGCTNRMLYQLRPLK
jgi:hypothetical protein